MKKWQIVIDTDVFISALRSRKGGSYKLLALLGTDKFEINVSVALVLEYEYVAKRYVKELALNNTDIDDIIDYICLVANKRKVFYLWRPVLKDPNDDMVLELASAANCDFIITFNKKDFRNEDLKPFGLKAFTPGEFLKKIGESS